jgi:hypothetical protein
MMTWRQNALKLRSIQDEDQANAQKWWDETDDIEKLKVWLAIQKPHDDPIQRIISRLAQLAYTEMAIAECKKEA